MKGISFQPIVREILNKSEFYEHSLYMQKNHLPCFVCLTISVYQDNWIFYQNFKITFFVRDSRT